MTNEELQIAIAKARGLNPTRVKEWDDVYGTHHMHDYSGDRNWYLAGTPIYYTENGVFYPLPDWPNDIAAAWKLAEEAGFSTWNASDVIIGKRFAAGFWREGNLLCYSYNGKPEDHLSPVQNSVELAICLAWLAWKAATK